MNSCGHRFRFAMTSALLGCLAACGGSDGSVNDGSASATSERFTVSSSPAFNSATKARKPEPTLRPGTEAPLDSAPDQVSKMPGIRLFATGFEPGVAFANDRVDSRYQHLIGGDAGYQFPITLGGPIAGWPSRINAEVGDAPSLAPEQFASASMPTVAGRDGLPTRAMALHSKAKSRAINAQQISLENAELASEPVIYQSMWIKFDVDTLTRARQHGADRFYQTFWEVRGKGYFRLRLKLHLDSSDKLVWVAKANGLEADDSAAGRERSWITQIDCVPVRLADEADAAGWHKVEIWLDAVGGRFKVSIDGEPLVDRAGVRPANGERVDTWRMMMIGSTVAPLARVLFDDLEFWSAPPAGAFHHPSH